MIYVADNATLGLPEINLGIFPVLVEPSASHAVLRSVSPNSTYSPATSLTQLLRKNRSGDMVVPAGSHGYARKFARKLCRKSPLALREAKQAVNMSMNLDIKSGCRAEQIAWSMLFSSEDQKKA